MTTTEYLEAVGFVLLIVLAFVATGLHRGIKGKQDDNEHHN